MKYAALVKRSVTIPGDERSRTNPGHGYPEHTEEFLDLVEFKGLAEMKDWVRRHVGNGYSTPSFRLIQFEELQFSTSIQIDIKEKP